MAIEIERKFLVKSNDFKKLAFKKIKIIQAYISKSSTANVRVRIADDLGFITIKGKSYENGLKRFEWENEINIDEAVELLKLCENIIVNKTRYLVKEDNGLTFEVDVFEEKNHGLIIAEIELESGNQSFTKPSWLGEEVTGIKKYYNSYISINPFNEW